MGWFKRIFNSESEEDSDALAEEAVELSKLSAWVDAKANLQFERVRPDIEEQFSRMNEEKKTLRSNLGELETAELYNPNVSEREKQIMEGNRNAYIHQHKQFLNAVNVSDNITCAETSNFCKTFEELLLNLAKSTAKGHAVMDAFFADHASRINKSIKAMSGAVSNIQELLEDADVVVEYIEEVQKSIAALKAKKKLLGELEQELDTLNKKLSNSVQMKDKILKSIEQLKQGAEYSEFSAANAERESLWKKLRSAEAEADQMLSPINKAMRKFERMLADNTKLFNKYIENPISGLAEDEGLAILQILQKMKKAIEDGSLELKDSDKAIQRVDEITPDKLIAVRSNHSEAKKSIKRIDDQMRNSRAMNDLNDLQYKVEHTEGQIKILNDKIDLCHRTKDKIDLDKLKQEASENIKRAFRIEVKIRCNDSHTA